MPGSGRDSCLATLISGDKTVFDEVYREFKVPIFTVIYRITRDRMLAEDVLHDVFVKLYKAPPSSQIKNPRAWLFRMARNLAIDSVRKPGSSALPEDMADNRAPMEDTVIDAADVETALRRLTREESEIVSLHLNAGLKFREIAEITNTPLGTVLWRYRKAIGALRDHLNGGLS